MAVPARPTSGVPIESAWGQIAHDTAVAMDIQTGTVTVSLTTATGSATVTFPRAFAGIPVVMAIVNHPGPSGSSAYFPLILNASTAQCVITLQEYQAAVRTTSIPVAWIAYGPRA
jgi:hypothetical protein